MKLSILIPTIASRKHMFDALLDNLKQQATPYAEDVQIMYNANTGNVGYKRQQLLEQCTGEYICFIDDDDEVSDKYVSSIISAIETKPDCVGIQGIMTTNGKLERQWEISKDLSWCEKNGVYYRHTNHLSPVKRHIALQVGFPNKTHGEDYDYSMGLRGKLFTEVKIEHSIYHYKFMSK